MNNTNYQKYKKPIKTWCIVQIAVSVVAFLAVIFLFFLPNFYIDMTEVPSGMRTTLPKIERRADNILNDLENSTDLDDLLKVINKSKIINFSFYDEIYASVNPVSNYNIDTNGAEIYQIGASIFLLAAVCMIAVSIVKNILGIISIDNFAIKTYDSLKRREKKSGYARFNSPTYFFVMGIVFEICSIFFTEVSNDAFGKMIATSYFHLMSGLSGASVVTILFIVVALGGFAVAKYLKGRISSEILKEEYAEKEENSQTNKAEIE